MGLDVNASRLQAAEQSPQVSRGPAENAAPRQEMVDAFQEALQGGEGGKSGGKKGAGQESAAGQGGKAETGTAGSGLEQGAALSASSLMESLFGNRMQAQGAMGAGEAVGSEQTSAAASARTAESAALVDKLVDRILVSDPGKGMPEVRISLSDKALPGTEISLSRAPDGQLAVKLSSTDPQSFQTLVAAQDSLRAALERQGENVRVDVSRSAGADAEQNDAQRQSRGYQNYQPDEER